MHLEPAQPSRKGPAERFTGDVWMDLIAARKPEPSRMIVNRVRFAPGARTAWHSHPLGQSLHVTEGTALVVTRDGTVIRATAGETVYTPPGEEHWHGAAAEQFMEHLAMFEAADDSPDGATVWLEHVGDDEYAAAQSIPLAASEPA